MSKQHRVHHLPKKVVKLRNENLLKSILDEESLCHICQVRTMNKCYECNRTFNNFKYRRK